MITEWKPISRRILVVGLVLVALVSVGLIASPINPVAWNAPAAGPDICATAPILETQVLTQTLPATPDGLGIDAQGLIVAGLANGQIVRIDPVSAQWRVAGRAPGAFLTGLNVAEDGTIFSVDERGGALHRLSPGSATARVAASAVAGRRLRWSNDVVEGSDGGIYMTTTSRRRSLDRFYDELLEHRGTGQLIRYDPQSGSVRELANGLEMTNGIAQGMRANEVLVVETSAYRVRQMGIGPGEGTSQIVIDNLPGFPGNIRKSASGHYWLTLLSPRNALVDQLSGWPSARRLMALLPTWARPKPEPFACVIKFDPLKDGNRVQAFRLHASVQLPSFSTAIEHQGRLYLSPAGMGRVDQGSLYVADL